MSEEHRQRTIRQKLAAMESQAVCPAIGTCVASLDAVLGDGGLPRGRIVEWFGPPSCGKTTLALQVVSHAQQRGSIAAWIDADRTFDAGYATALGVALERLPVARPESAEEALAIVRQLLESGAVDLVVVDSAAALTPSLELNSGVTDDFSGLQARVLASGLRRMGCGLRRSGAAALFLNQTRGRPDAAEVESSAGGPSLKLYAPLRLAFLPEQGRRLRLRTLKNHAAAALREAVLEWREGGGLADPL